MRETAASGEAGVRGRLARALVLGLAALCPILAGVAWVLDPQGRDLVVLGLGVALTAAGAVIALRRPGNAIGWIFLVAGASTGLALLTGSYTARWLEGRGGDPGLAALTAAYANASWVPFILPPLTFLLLLFPDGRLPGPRWRWIGRAAALGMAGTLAGELVVPGPISDFPEIENPIGWDSSALDPLTGLMFLTLLAGVFGSAAALRHRVRTADPAERQQLKWLAFAGALGAVTFAVALAGFPLWGEDVTDTMCMVAVLGLPVATGIAILRHRLFDIDVVINRTLVYGGLSLVLAAAYVTSVLLLQLVLSPSSDVAVAASTLAAAALVRPARARIQTAVDRRFYRRRYDAQRTLEAFATRLRDEVSLDAVGTQLRAVTAQTLRPAHVSLWLREDGR